MIALLLTYPYDSLSFLPWVISGADYGYDANGNLEYDRHRRITSIDYNAIDQPQPDPLAVHLIHMDITY